MPSIIKQWLLTAACALAACQPLSGQAQPYFANKQGDQIWDNATGLVWQRCSVGQTWNGKTCTGTAQTYLFDQARNLTDNGWRMPTIRELASLIYCSSGRTTRYENPRDGGPAIANNCDGTFSVPTINVVAFPATPSEAFWSSSQHVDDRGQAWSVIFDIGHVYYYTHKANFYVRLVRANQLPAGEAALAFPVSLAAKSHQGQAQEHARAVREQQQRAAAEAREEEAKRAFENSPAGRAKARREQQARQLCEAQKASCKASCPPLGTTLHNEGHDFCMFRCERISCF